MKLANVAVKISTSASGISKYTQYLRLKLVADMKTYVASLLSTLVSFFVPIVIKARSAQSRNRALLLQPEQIRLTPGLSMVFSRL